MTYPDHSIIYTDKNVIQVQNGHDNVSVLTQDGETYHGDIVVGADGVSSRVLSEMWKSAQNPSLAEQERKGMENSHVKPTNKLNWY